MPPDVDAMNAIPADVPQFDSHGLKSRQHKAWSSGDYAVIGTTLQIVGEQLAETCDICWDEQVLDVAAGNGNATLAAARRGAVVTSTDYVTTLLDTGAERAKAECLDVQFRFADAEALPFHDAEFDVVLSTFGVMFTPDHEKATAEILRVCRPGGRIGLASWTPDGFIGRLFKVIGWHLPPPPGSRAPSLWGTEAHVRALFGLQAQFLSIQRRQFCFRYRSAAHFIETFRTWYGPLHAVFKALDNDKAIQLERDLTALLDECNRASGRHSLVVPSEYLEVVLARR